MSEFNMGSGAKAGDAPPVGGSDVKFDDNLSESLQDNDKARKWARGRFHEMKEARRPWEDSWTRAYKYYRSWPEPKNQDWKATLFVPLTFQAVETILPRVVQGLFSIRPSFVALPTPDMATLAGGPQAAVALAEKARLVEQVLDEQLENQIKLRKIAQTVWFRECLIYGSAPGIITWDVLLNRPRFQALDIMDWWCDPQAEDVSTAQYACHRVRITVDELRKRAKAGIYDADAVKKVKPKTDAETPAQERLKEVGLGAEDNSYRADGRMVELIEFWRRDRVMTFDIDFNATLRNTRNEMFDDKCLPYVLARYTPIPHELYGMGIPELGESLQLEMNDTRNLRIDGVKMSMCGMAAVPFDWDDEQNKVCPGAMFKLADPSSVKWISPPDVSQGGLMEEDRIRKDWDQTFGTYDYTRGSAARANETATGINIIVQEGNVRYGMTVSILEDTVRELIEKLYLLDQLWLQPPMLVRMADENGVRFQSISEDTFDGTYDISIVTSSTLGNKDIQRMQVRDLVQTILQTPEFMRMTDWYPLYKQFLSKWEMRDAAGVIKSQDVLAQEDAHAQWMQQAIPFLQTLAQQGIPEAQQLLATLEQAPPPSSSGGPPAAPPSVGGGPGPQAQPGRLPPPTPPLGGGVEAA